MTEAIKVVTFINIVFIILLVISGSIQGFVGEAVYYLAFLLPVLIGFYSAKDLRYKREEIAGIAEAEDKLLTFDGKRALKLLPLIAPLVTVIFAISVLTSLLLSLFGVEGSAIENEGLISMILAHAVVPALFEELLFRYIPLKLLLPYSRRWCVFYSSLCFALIHCSFLQMPYAFVAGIAFMLLDVAFGSVWPSVILHFVNNSASVIASKYCTGPISMTVFVSTLLVLSIVSLAFVFIKKDSYKKLLRGTLAKGETTAVTYAPLALAAICCYAAFLNI